MTAPGNDVLLTVLVVAMTVCTGYAAGRIHQWYRTALERDQAYRDGYDTATRSLFSVAARIIRPRRSDKAAVRGTATVTSILAAPSNTAPSNTAPPHTAPSNTTPPHVAPRNAAPRNAALVDAAPSNVSHLPAAPPNASAAKATPHIGLVPSAEPDSAGRHTVPDSLVSGPTYRLPPDRVARAKVPQPSAEAAARNAQIAKEANGAPNELPLHHEPALNADPTAPIPKPRAS